MDSKYPKTLEKPYKYLLREKGKKDVKRKKKKRRNVLITNLSVKVHKPNIKVS